MTTIPARAKPAWPWRAEVLVLLAATLLAGCATAPRDAHVGDTARLDHQAELGESGVSGASNATGIESSVLNLNLLGGAETRPAFWPSYPRPQLQFASLDAASSAGPALSTTESEPSIFSKDYCKTLGLEVKETVVAPAHWEGRDWLLLSGVTAGIVAVGVFDEDIQRAVQRNRNHTTDDIFNAVEPFGQGYSYAVLGAFYLGGEFFKDSQAKSVALDGLSASIIASGLIDQPLKYAFGRNRPSAGRGAYVFQPFSGHDSFPSGHATQAFAVASVISEHYDSLWIKGAAYGLASMVGYARLNSNAHWASDVVAGAAIGTVVGRFVVHFNQQHHSVSFAPILGPGMQGGALTWAF